MSAFEDSFKSQLQGVSQQIARERLDGQVSQQINMLSDAATNVRRRPGAEYKYHVDGYGGTADSTIVWDTDISGIKCQVVLDISTGVVRVLDAGTYAVLATLPASAYLTTSSIEYIQATTVGDELFFVNTTVHPALGVSGTGVLDPEAHGFFWIKAGAFSKTYDVTVTHASGSPTLTYKATYTTPDGTAAGDADKTTPDYIAQKLADAINAVTLLAINASPGSSEVFLTLGTTGGGLKVETSSGSSYVVVSGSSYLRDVADLPAKFVSGGSDGYIIKTGDFSLPRYYRYSYADVAWLECGSYTSELTLTGCPISLAYNAGWALVTDPFEGRLAGDADNNPAPAFVDRGITGVATYQGRLVLLAGPTVCMSASNHPRRFYRSTMTGLLDNDTIGVRASAASSAAFVHGVEFGKDLLLFSEKYQAVVAGSNVAITPRTAAVVIISSYIGDVTSRPVPAGRTLMYPAPRSKDYFGLMEMEASPNVDSSYTSYDSTAHLPKYMLGRCRASVSSSVANMVVFMPTDERNTMVVHEYTWEGANKVQRAWHKWTFRYNIANAYFAGAELHIVFVQNGVLVTLTIDPRASSSDTSAVYRAPLDFSTVQTVTDHLLPVPNWLRTFDPSVPNVLAACVSTGVLKSEPVGVTVEPGNLRTNMAYSDGDVNLGVPYTSVLEPSPPMMKDYNGVKVSSNKTTVLRYMIGTSNSREYMVSVSDSHTTSPEALPESPLLFSSVELELGEALVGGADSVSVVPARTVAESTHLVLSTDGTGDMNVVSLEFVLRYREKIKRRRG